MSNLTDEFIVAAKGGSHECGRDTKNPLESLFDAPKLVVNLVVSQGSKILVGPGVGSDLMSFVINILGAINARRIIDTPP